MRVWRKLLHRWDPPGAAAAAADAGAGGVAAEDEALALAERLAAEGAAEAEAEAYAALDTEQLFAADALERGPAPAEASGGDAALAAPEWLAWREDKRV